MKRWTITSDKFLSKDQVIRLIAYLTDQRDLSVARGCQCLQVIRNYYLIRALLETGVRVQECCDLENRDVAGRKLTVRRGKGGKARTILLTGSTSNLLKEWLLFKLQLRFSDDPIAPLFPSRYHEPYSTRGIQKQVKRVFQSLQFPTVLSCHSLRHTNATLLLESKKVSLPQVRDNLGHHSLTVTNLYSHAVGDIDDVELYPAPGSAFTEKSEPRNRAASLTTRNPVKQLLRKANFK